jgi:hypothetical protein
MAELVRQLIADSLAAERPPNAEIPLSAFKQIVGMGESGRDDIGTDHDRRLAEALRKRHDG